MPRDTLALEAMAGTVLEEKYRLLRVIGSGAMAHVYEAEQIRLGRSVAVKIMRTGLMADKRSLERFRTEGLAASRINHPHAIAIYDLGVTKDGVPFLVMELLRGKTLANLLLEEPFTMERIVSMAAQILSALEEAHTCGVIHRDLKSENVIVDVRRDGSDFAKVLDFGIAAFQDRPDLSIVGTPEYMAPEQALGDPVDLRADVYAAGVLLYEMLTGELPLVAKTPMATIVAHQTRAPDPPSRHAFGIPAGADALVLRALAKRPEDRFPSMEALAAEAARVRAGLARTTQPGAAARPSRPRAETVALPPAPIRLSRRIPWPAIAAAVLVVAAGALAAAILRSGASPVRVGMAPAVAAPPPAAAPAKREEPPPPAPPPPALVEEAASARAAPPPAADPARPARKAARRSPPRDPDAELKDPYGGAGQLKDPFQ
jgi:eukaryotic-like serine/threonine-protein kinase